jgi:hypothetical protein
MEQFVVPLPVEPVGNGAKWSVNRTQDVSGLKLNVSCTQELVDLADKAISLRSKEKGRAKDQKIDDVEVSSLILNNEGSQKIDLGRLVPTEARLSISTTTTTAARHGETSTDALVTMSLKLTEPGKFKAPAPEAAKPVAPDNEKAKPKF